MNPPETAEEHLRHAIQYSTEVRRRLLAALRELEREHERCERPLRELENEDERRWGGGDA
jgi:hypothetical protein